MTENKDLVRLAACSGYWPADSIYFSSNEAHIENQWNALIFPFISDCNFSVCVDLAAGHGRNTQYLLKYAKEVIVVDYVPDNVDVCRKRFSDFKNIQFLVNNGFDLRPIPDGTVTLVYCFDAMVHFDSDIVRSYLKDIFRVLTPGGRAFLHHSNSTVGAEWGKNPHGRNFMSSELFAHYATKEGLTVVRQHVLDWGVKDLDCFSLLQRDA